MENQSQSPKRHTRFKRSTASWQLRTVPMPFKCITANLSWTPFFSGCIGRGFYRYTFTKLKIGGGCCLNQIPNLILIMVQVTWQFFGGKSVWQLLLVENVLEDPEWCFFIWKSVRNTGKEKNTKDHRSHWTLWMSLDWSFLFRHFAFDHFAESLKAAKPWQKKNHEINMRSSWCRPKLRPD